MSRLFIAINSLRCDETIIPYGQEWQGPYESWLGMIKAELGGPGNQSSSTARQAAASLPSRFLFNSWQIQEGLVDPDLPLLAENMISDATKIEQSPYSALGFESCIGEKGHFRSITTISIGFSPFLDSCSLPTPRSLFYRQEHFWQLPRFLLERPSSL